MDKSSKETFALYIRNFIFGVEDSLVSTVGLLAGIATAGVSRTNIILAGIILIFVESFSMAIGSLLSEHSVEEYVRGKETSLTRSTVGGIIMFFSYLGAGIIPLFPYIFMSSRSAFSVSIILALIALFLLGTVSAKIFRVRILRHGFEMLVLGGVAVAVGILVGQIVKTP